MLNKGRGFPMVIGRGRRREHPDDTSEGGSPVADLERGDRGVRPPPLKFAEHMLYNVN